MSETFYRRAISQWEDPDGRLDIVLEFLSEKNPQSIPSFWDWDAKMNPEGFSKEGHHP
jgi:hypothetical protein